MVVVVKSEAQTLYALLPYKFLQFVYHRRKFAVGDCIGGIEFW